MEGDGESKTNNNQQEERAPIIVCPDCYTDASAASLKVVPSSSSSSTPNPKGTIEDVHNFTIMSFNVFTGSPIPFYGNTSPSLEDSDRLRLQVGR